MGMPASCAARSTRSKSARSKGTDTMARGGRLGVTITPAPSLLSATPEKIRRMYGNRGDRQSPTTPQAAAESRCEAASGRDPHCALRTDHRPLPRESPAPPTLRRHPSTADTRMLVPTPTPTLNVRRRTTINLHSRRSPDRKSATSNEINNAKPPNDMRKQGKSHAHHGNVIESVHVMCAYS